MNYPMNNIRIDMLGSEEVFFGDLADEYFRNLAAHAAQNQLLINVARHLSIGSNTFLDVGANIGVTARLVRLIHPESTICALEPSPKAYAYLKRNSDSRMRLFNLAAGKQNGVVNFFEADFLAGSSISIQSGGWNDKRKTIPVELTSLDQLTKENNINNVKLVKIDVEGFELDVLEGAKHLIQRDNPVFVCEFNSYAIAANGKISPYALLSLILATFDRFYSFRNGKSACINNDKDARDFLYQNMVVHGCVEDIYFGGDSSFMS